MITIKAKLHHKKPEFEPPARDFQHSQTQFSLL